MNASDIAKIAGVSRSTVSRVINNYGNVTEETRQRVLEIIKEYNYVPHASAQMLAGKKNRIIGLFIIDTKDDNYANKMCTSSYFSPFTSAVIDAANKQRYNVLSAIVNEQQDFNNVKELFFNKTISAGIFIGGKNNEPAIAEIIESGYNVAVIEQEVSSEQEPFSKCIVVNNDSFGGAYEATKYLIQLGHGTIAHITGDLDQFTAISRLEGYKKALLDGGVPVKSNLIIKGNYTEESGYRAAKKLLLKETPTAMFVANDSMCLGAIRAIEELRLKIPEDISLIGFDDIEVARYLQPALTTVRIPLLNMAFMATNNLIKANEEEMNFFANYKIPVELVVRDSCRKIR
ncbi:LacI family DNA-binding transcriptional regulator [Geosporobacter ferrireducens]|uniref:Transcriptional regulator n=1 Tax=Geosporobacter ferrireducens TaxID=1424294 RepID=A0A1D8GEJ0_9FIRM|nr:LacI family DNA-binding transcriptional regulator [Geosporobacter ferrireducens]AOT69314.1 transcriptional regulator [Geosporobacter ferrireducens]MTI57000.1 LacI family transcriptional regulator [Geosporobacter ferrireducens]